MHLNTWSDEVPENIGTGRQTIIKNNFFKQSNAIKMKKNLINRFAVIMITALLTLTAANTFAATQPVKMNFTVHPDTPYLAEARIYRSGMADTPYLSFSIPPVLLSSQLNSLVGNQAGLFHVFIQYINEEGEKLDEEDYYIDNRDNPDGEIKYD
jgi:hypothetical protein